MVKGLNLKKTHRQSNLLWASLSPWEQDSAADLHHPNSLEKGYRWILSLFWVRGVLLPLQMHAGFHLFAFLFGNGVGSLLPAYLCHHKVWKLLSSMFFFFYFFKQKTSLSLTHSTEGNGALKKNTKYGQTHGQGAAAGGPARSPRHWGFLICPGMVHHWELLITFQQYSPWCDGIHNSNQEKERTQALSSSPRQGVEVKKHPGQFSRKDFAIPPSSKSHLPNSRVRGRNDTSGTVFF